MEGFNWYIEQIKYTHPEILQIKNPELPKQLWAYIFTFTDIQKDSLNIQLCCKQWYNATRHQTYLCYMGLCRIKETKWFKGLSKETQKEFVDCFTFRIGGYISWMYKRIFSNETLLYVETPAYFIRISGSPNICVTYICRISGNGAYSILNERYMITRVTVYRGLEILFFKFKVGQHMISAINVLKSCPTNDLISLLWGFSQTITNAKWHDCTKNTLIYGDPVLRFVPFTLPNEDGMTYRITDLDTGKESKRKRIKPTYEFF